MTGHPAMTIASATAEIGTIRYAVAIRTGHHQLVSDEPTQGGGGDAGASPFGLVLSGLGACTAITLRMYAERKGWDLAAVHVGLVYRQQGERGAVERKLRLDGKLDQAQRVRLAEIAERTPVTRALRSAMDIDTILL